MTATVAAVATNSYSTATAAPDATMPSGISAGHLLLTQVNTDGGQRVGLVSPR
jgi:hypothetical protein